MLPERKAGTPRRGRGARHGEGGRRIGGRRGLSETPRLPIPRVQLLEIEDQPWFPTPLRDLVTEFLRFAERRFRLHRHAVPIMERALRDSGAREVLDLCSGASGIVPELAGELAARGIDVRWTLTDLYPNLAAMENAELEGGGRIAMVREPIDARFVPGGMTGLRTFFNAFHHFGPDEAREILRAAAEAGQPVAVLEIPERSATALLQCLLVPVVVLLGTPFMRPSSWRRLVFTYLLPVVPLTCLWDGMVSQLRAYRPEELLDMGRTVAPGYRWEAGVHREPGAPGRLTYLLGRLEA